MGVGFSLRSALELLPSSQRGRLVLVSLVSVLGAAFETAGIASILPFIGILMDPSAVDRYAWMQRLVQTLSIPKDYVVFTVGIATILVLTIGNAAAAANNWLQQTFIARVRRLLAGELFEGYMRQPYAFHVQRDAASLTKVIFYDAETVVGAFLSPLLTAFSRALVAAVLLGFLILLDPGVAFGVIVLMGGSYLILYRAMRDQQSRLGTLVNDAALERGRTAIEGIGGIKELRILGREYEHVRRFKSAMQVLTHAQVNYNLTMQVPRYVLEVLAFGGIVLVALLLTRTRDAQTVIPILALYAFAGYRLMPAFQQIYSAVLSVRFSSAALASVENDLTILRRGTRSTIDEQAKSESLPFRNEIRFDRVTFIYPGAERPVLKDASLSIRRNESIGLVGRTGAGKTTLADLLLGLYSPNSGTICIDGRRLDSGNIGAWQQQMGYVPQQVFLANATVAENIAFGLPRDNMDHKSIKRAAYMAQADEFVQSLPDKYDTIIGERGVRLSGGQRQRLGIARALYHNPDVLVLDEATSALDGLTEDAVMDAVRDLSAERTVILIAHRLRTIEACDRIVMLHDGKIVANGSYSELIAHSPAFNFLVNARAAP